MPTKIRMPHGSLKKLAEATGDRPSYLCDMIATRKRPGRKKAKQLEKISNVSKITWLYGSSVEIKKELIENTMVA